MQNRSSFRLFMANSERMCCVLGDSFVSRVAPNQMRFSKFSITAFFQVINVNSLRDFLRTTKCTNDGTVCQHKRTRAPVCTHFHSIHNIIIGIALRFRKVDEIKLHFTRGIKIPSNILICLIGFGI